MRWACALLALSCASDTPPYAVAPGARSDAGVRTETDPPADIEVTLQYLGSPETVTFDASADPWKVDVHLLLEWSRDTMSIASERDITERLVPALEERFDVAFGLSYFRGYFVPPDGGSALPAYELLLFPTQDRASLSAAVDRLFRIPQVSGNFFLNGGTTASFEALYQAMTGEGAVVNGYTLAEGPAVRFRSGSLRVVAHQAGYRPTLPDDVPDLSPVRDVSEAIAALRARDILYLGVVRDGTPADGEKMSPRTDLEQVAVGTNSVIPADEGRCDTRGFSDLSWPAEGEWCPMVFSGDVEARRHLSGTVVEGLTRYLDAREYGAVEARVTEDEHGFVRDLVAVEAVPEALVDGIRFESVDAGATMTFSIRLRNTVVRQTSMPQRFDVLIEVVSAVQGILGEKRVRVTVPPREVDAGLI